jgi:hypothetical protein
MLNNIQSAINDQMRDDVATNKIPDDIAEKSSSSSSIGNFPNQCT